MSATLPYIDLQFNGLRGASFKRPDELPTERLHQLCADLRDTGCAGFLATVTTDQLDHMAACLRHIVQARQQDQLIREMIPGIHIEGPFLNPEPGYRGAHREAVMQLATPEAVKPLLDAADGLTRILTLAPERDPACKTTRFLADQHITVSAGHTNASLDQLRAAIDAGLAMFTHLGNGCPMQIHRHDNIIQRTLSLREHLWLCFIADGAHIDWPALGNYLALAGDRAILVSDASSLGGLPPGEYEYHGKKTVVGTDGVPRAPDGSHLAGAGITIDEAARRLRTELGLDDARLRQLVHDNPLKALR